jgi:hypothetical protein
MANQFVTREIAILDEHDLVDDDGNVVMSLTADKLNKIADNNNRRIEETGDETPIVIGHTKDDAVEKAQPEIVGWAKRFTVKPLFNTGRKAIWVMARFMKNKIDKVKNFPRRSVELWLRKMMVDPISLLGATTPERDLGVLKFANGDHRYSTPTVSDTSTPMNDNVDSIVQKVLQALQQTDVWKAMEAQMGQGEQVPQDDGLGGDEGGDMPLDDEPIPGDGGGDDVPLDDDLEDEPKQYNAVAGYPSGSNVAIPAGDRKRMQRDQKRGQLARLQASHKQLMKQNADLLLRFQRSEREKDLIQLESEGFQFDRAEELEDLAALPDNVYRKRLNLIRKRYSKAPVGGRGFHTVTETRGGKERTRDQVQGVIEYAQKHGLSYEQAVAKMEGEKVF